MLPKDQNVQNSTLRTFYNIVETYLDERLVNRFWSKKLQDLFIQLPPVSLVNLEIRLKDDNPRVDGNILLKPFESSTLSSWIKGNEIADLYFLLKALEDWTNPNTLFHSVVGNMWLMYDLDTEQMKLPIPWVIFSIPRLNIGRDVFLSILKKLCEYFPNTFSDLQWTIFKNALDHMPRSIFVPAIGIQNRGANTLRFGVKGLKGMASIEKYLLAIEWPGDKEFIKKHYAETIELAEYCDLSFTIGKSLFPDLGIECYFRPGDSEAHNHEILTHVRSIGLCSDLKYQAILDWYGKDLNVPDIWHNPLPSLDDQDEQYVLRHNGTIKLVYTPGSEASAKAYLYFERTH